MEQLKDRAVQAIPYNRSNNRTIKQQLYKSHDRYNVYPLKGIKRAARFVNQTLCCLFFIASELSTPFWEQWCPCNISIKRVRDLTLIYISEYHDHVLLCILIRTLTELESDQI